MGFSWYARQVIFLNSRASQVSPEVISRHLAVPVTVNPRMVR